MYKYNKFLMDRGVKLWLDWIYSIWLIDSGVIVNKKLLVWATIALWLGT